MVVYLCGQRGAHSIPRRWPRLLFTDTARGRRLGLRNTRAKDFIFCGAQSARASPRKEPADRPQSTCAQGVGVVVFEANAGRAPPHTVGRASTSPTPRQVGGCGFMMTQLKFSNAIPRESRALRSVDNRPSAHRARARLRSWRGCLCSQRGNAGYAPSHAIGRGFSSPTPREVAGWGIVTP